MPIRIINHLHIRGVLTAFFVSPIGSFYERSNLVLVLGHLDKSFLRNFGPKLGLFLAISGGYSAQNAKIRSLSLSVIIWPFPIPSGYKYITSQTFESVT